MELSLEFEFRYPQDPGLYVTLHSPLTALESTAYALIDTGAQRSLFDYRILRDINHHETPLQRATLFGVGGSRILVEVFQMSITLAGEKELTVELPIAFSEDIEHTAGNLIGLDVLEHFDFALAHRDRLGYLGRR